MRVIISVGGRFHADHAARAAQKVGCLKKYITTLSTFKKRETGIDPALLKSITLPDYVGFAIRRTPVLRDLVTWNSVKDNLFDLMASRYVDQCNIFHGWNNYSLFSLRKAKRYGAKVVIERSSAHPLTVERLLTEEYSKYGLRRPKMLQYLVQKQIREYDEADYIMVPSDFVYNSMVEEGVPAEKLIKIPLGVDLRAFKPVEKTDNKFRVLFVGMLSLQKGVQYLLEAVKQLRLPNFELVLIGGPRDNFKPIMAKYDGEYTYLGSVPHNKLYKYYSNCSVFVLPAVQEGSGMVVTEAMACGLPVIVSENVGARDFVREGIDGFIIPIRDVEALKEKILFFHENEDARRRMGESARERVKGLSWESYERELIKAYHQILHG